MLLGGLPVLDDPVLLPINIVPLEAIAHHQHTVVQILTAALLLNVDA